MPLPHRAAFLWYIHDQIFYMRKNVLLALLLIAFTLPTFVSAQDDEKTKAGLNHIAIFVNDLRRTVSFYHDVFRLDTIPEPFHDKKHAWYSIAPGVALHVIEGADKPKEYFKNNHMCFSVGAIDKFIEKLKRLNIKYEDAQGKAWTVTNRVDGVHQLWITDPDGYWIEVNDAKN